jgi:hypothetical protein
MINQEFNVVPESFIEYQKGIEPMDWEWYKANMKNISGFEVLEPFEKFDINGLKFPIEYLNKIGLFNVFFPLEKIQDYADTITSSLIDNNSFIKKQINIDYNYIMSCKDSIGFFEINATSVGSIALVYNTTIDKDIKEKCLYILNFVYKKAINFILEHKKEAN